MVDFVKVGAVLTFVGFLSVGSGILYAALSSPATLEQAQALGKNSGVLQGLGWIVAGIGLYLALFGSAKSDTAIDTKSEILLGRLPLRKSKFVCEKCGGDVSKETTRCPHCGSPLEE